MKRQRLSKGGTNMSYISEHRLKASQILDRPLTQADIIHHLDGNRLNNNEENLFITNRLGHKKPMQV